MTNAATQPDLASQVVLIGGTNTSAFRRHLEAWGVNVSAEAPFPPLKTPKGASALVVLKTHCSHRLFTAARKLADVRGIPLVAVEQSWSQALPILQQAGIVPQIRAVTPDPVTPDPVTPAPDVPGLVYQLQSRLVRLEAHLGQAEDMILERDDLILQMSQRLDDMTVSLDEITANAAMPQPIISIGQGLTHNPRVERTGPPWQAGEVWKSSTGLAHRIIDSAYDAPTPACGVRWGSSNFLAPRTFLWTRSTGEPTCFQCRNR